MKKTDNSEYANSHFSKHFQGRGDAPGPPRFLGLLRDPRLITDILNLFGPGYAPAYKSIEYRFKLLHILSTDIKYCIYIYNYIVQLYSTARLFIIIEYRYNVYNTAFIVNIIDYKYNIAHYL